MVERFEIRGVSLPVRRRAIGEDYILLNNADAIRVEHVPDEDVLFCYLGFSTAEVGGWLESYMAVLKDGTVMELSCDDSVWHVIAHV